MQMSAESHDLIVFRENIREILRIPHICDARIEIGTEVAAVHGVVDHRMREDNHKLIRIFFCDLGERFIQPLLCGVRIGHRIGADRQKRDHMEAVHDTVAVALVGKRVFVDIGKEIILAEDIVEILGRENRASRPCNVVVAGHEDHRRFRRRKCLLIDGLVILHLAVFAAVAARIDQVSHGKHRIKTVLVVDQRLLFELGKCVFQFFGSRIRRAVRDMHIADRGKGKHNAVGIKRFWKIRIRVARRSRPRVLGARRRFRRLLRRRCRIIILGGTAGGNARQHAGREKERKEFFHNGLPRFFLKI